MRAGLPSLEVHSSYATSVSASSMPDGDVPCVVASAFAVSNFGECERVVRSAFPEVVVYGAFEVPKAGSAWFVGSKDDVLFATVG
jgi:hypothetical protein